MTDGYLMDLFWMILKIPNSIKRKRWSYILGLTSGLLVALHLAQPHLVHEIEHRVAELSGLVVNNDLIQSTIMEYLPSAELIKDFFKDEILPGEQLLHEGVKAKHPVVLIPGFISTGLELWQSRDNCFRNPSRKRIWGTLSMLQAVLLDTSCWFQHLALDPITGRDPEGIRARASEGFDAADFIVGGFWVWAKVIDNLAVVGYDSSNMIFASHDWRLSPVVLEERDRYFSRLVRSIEGLVEAKGEKVVLIGHSLAANVMHYLLKFAESDKGGRRGPKWVEDHIASVVNIGGGYLGVPKAIPSWVSGEMKDTIQLGIMDKVFMRDQFGAEVRRKLFRTWNSVNILIPTGGNRLWGDEYWSPEEASIPHPEGITSFGFWALFARERSERVKNTEFPISDKNITLDEMYELLKKDMDSSQSLRVPGSQFSRSKILDDEKNFFFEPLVAKNPELFDHPRHWASVLSSALPYAPSLTIYSLYGVGQNTERGYFYNDISSADSTAIGPFSVIDDDGVVRPRVVVDNTVAVSDVDKLPHVKMGVLSVEGDGTVPLVSLGIGTRWLWKGKTDFNPAGARAVTKEYENSKDFALDFRGGGKGADHVDIMGNFELIKDVLRIATGLGDSVNDHIMSDVDRIVERVNLNVNATKNGDETSGKPNLDVHWSKKNKYALHKDITEKPHLDDTSKLMSEEEELQKPDSGESNRDEL